MEVDPDKGLNSGVALSRLKEFGENVLSEKKPTPWYIDLFHELTGFFSLMLWVGAAFCIIAYELDPSDPSNVNTC